MSTPVIHTQPGEHIVAYFSTRKLYDLLPAAYNSLLAFTPNIHVCLFIEDDTLPYDVPQNVTIVNVSGQDIFPRTGPCFRTKYTYMVLLKTALTKIFPDADKVLILDVDTIVCADISGIWDYDLSGYYYAAVIEPAYSAKHNTLYANFGVVMLNLRMLRTTGTDDLIISELNTNYHPYPEQDAFNLICKDRFLPLPPDYNCTTPGFGITGTPSRTIIRHFAGFNEWADFQIVQYWLTHTKPYPRYVVYAGNRRVYSMISRSAKSLLCNTPIDKIFLLIEHDDFPEQLPDIFHTINVSSQTIFPPSCPNIMTYYTYMTALRTALTKILPDDISRILWLDPDTVTVDDISDLWNTDLQYSYLAAVEETRNNNHAVHPYYNAGVMLLNLAKLRSDRMDDKLINAINTTPYKHLEQDAINFLCSPCITPLPSAYSASFVTEPTDHPRIHHFLAGNKPQFPKTAEPYAQLDWDQVMDIQNKLKEGEYIG